MEKPLTILYTANIRGDLHLLPRMFAFIKHLKRDTRIAPTRVLLLDLGNACAPSSWHCAVTGGRSTLIVLDAMGYAAADVSAYLTDEGREKLTGIVSLALIDAVHWWQSDALAVIHRTEQMHDNKLNIITQAADITRLDGNVLHLAAVDARQIGIAQIALNGDSYTLFGDDILAMPAHTFPEPTIAASVEFVISEARYAQRRRDS
ncbi:MAG: hypothetical protein D6737_16795 [Chloroflexi bacterium]|nr:MAG: hypothetical protein D6737_16795 [Chloroflexota bacterium]